MGKIKMIQKSRKDYKCSKCGKIIPKGSSYWKGELNFHPSIYRCLKCGLKNYEVTTSSYVSQVGEIVEDWSESYSAEEGCWEEISSALGEIRDELECNLENMPEQLQESETGQLLQERIESLESVMSDLENADIDEFKDAAFNNLPNKYQSEELKSVIESEEWQDKLSSFGEETTERFMENLKEEIESFIDECLNNLEY